MTYPGIIVFGIAMALLGYMTKLLEPIPPPRPWVLVLCVISLALVACAGAILIAAGAGK